MRLPDSLAALVDYGIIQEVVRPLMSGKEAQIYLVISEGEERVAKVYKEAHSRTFKHRAEYTEGRKTRNSRDQRAISKRTRHGRAQDEAAWRSTEVDMIYRLRDAGACVPEPYQFVDGVLVMELVKDAQGDPAPRLGDGTYSPEQALEIYHALIAQVVRMLCAGVVHGDLSDFNVLMGADGPVVIDFPQAVDPASNQNARRLLIRDVENLQRFLARFAPHARRPLYAQEMWELYQSNRLRPTTKLKGGYRPPRQKTDTTEVLTLIGEAGDEARARRQARGEEAREEEAREEEPAAAAPPPLRRVVDLTQDAPKSRGAQKKKKKKKKSARPRRRAGAAGANVARSASAPAEAKAAGAPEQERGAKKRRRRRRPGRSGQSGAATAAGTSAGPDGTKREAPKASSPAPKKKRVRRRRRSTPGGT